MGHPCLFCRAGPRLKGPPLGGLGAGRDRQPLPCPSDEDTLWGRVPRKFLTEPFSREHHWLLCQCTSSSAWKRGTAGCLPPWRHTDSWDPFLPVRSEHVAAVSCGTGSTVPAGRCNGPKSMALLETTAEARQSHPSFAGEDNIPLPRPFPQMARPPFFPSSTGCPWLFPGSSQGW